jgi:hypothetical protein
MAPSANPKMKCRLCHGTHELCRSHVFPEFLYRPLYGKTHRIRTVHAALPYVRRLRKGLRERLLCTECETHLSRYEQYFASVWYGPSGLPAILSMGEAVCKSGLDYPIFKLFHLSILWRASVSALDDFAGVTLGPHEERLRKMILTGNPGAISDYRLAASVLLRPNSRTVHTGIIGAPSRQRVGSHSYYSSVYAGCIWHCLMSNSMRSDIPVLSENGQLVMHIIDVRSVPEAFKLVKRAASA